MKRIFILRGKVSGPDIEPGILVEDAGEGVIYLCDGVDCLGAVRVVQVFDPAHRIDGMDVRVWVECTDVEFTGYVEVWKRI